MAQGLNKPRAIFPVSERDERRNSGHSQQEICIRWDGLFNFDGVAVNGTAFGAVSLDVDGLLLAGALAGLDEEQLGFFCQRRAIKSVERCHQILNSDGASVHAVHTSLLAVAQNATHQAARLTVVSAAELPHQGQHLRALAVRLCLYLKAEPLKHFVQTLWKAHR